MAEVYEGGETFQSELLTNVWFGHRHTSVVSAPRMRCVMAAVLGTQTMVRTSLSPNVAEDSFDDRQEGGAWVGRETTIVRFKTVVQSCGSSRGSS